MFGLVAYLHTLSFASSTPGMIYFQHTRAVSLAGYSHRRLLEDIDSGGSERNVSPHTDSRRGCLGHSGVGNEIC